LVDACKYVPALQALRNVEHFPIRLVVVWWDVAWRHGGVVLAAPIAVRAGMVAVTYLQLIVICPDLIPFMVSATDVSMVRIVKSRSENDGQTELLI